MNDEATYTLTVSKAQLAAISNACEIVARLGLGQVKDALQALRGQAGTRDFLDAVAVKEIEDVIHQHGGFCGGSSWSVGHNKDTDRLWVVHGACRYRLAWDRAIADGEATADGVSTDKAGHIWGTYYQKPLNWSGEPLPAVVKVVVTS